MLPPSILIDSKRYYVHEVAELVDGRWVIPALWIKFRGTMHADCHLVGRDVSCALYWRGLELNPCSAIKG